MIKFVILNFGYVESSHPFSWIFEHETGFQTKFEAAQALALEIFQIYNEKYLINKKALKKCCEKFKSTNHYDPYTDHYCNKCGNNLESNSSGLNIEEYQEWLYDNSRKNHDEGDLSEHFGSYSLFNCMNVPCGITEDNYLYISQAEKILTALLYNTNFTQSLNEDIDSEVLYNSTFEKFKLSFDNDDGPSIYA